MNPVILRRTLFWFPFAVALAGAVYLLLRPESIPVDIGTVSRGVLTITVGDEGRTRVRDVFELSAPLTGRQRRIAFEVGDTVVAGKTVVVRIEPTDPGFLDVRSEASAEAAARAAVAARSLAEAELRRAQTELEFARSELERARRLSRSNISESALDEARRRFEIQEAVVDEARAQLEVRAFELERANAQLLPSSLAADQRGACDCIDVRSPVSGTILRILRKSAGVVAAGEPLVEIGDPARLEVVVELLSSDAVRVEAGQRVLVRAWGGDDALEGVVRRVEPFGFTKVSALGIEEQRVNVVIDFTGPRESWARLGHGYRVETDIVLWEGDDVPRVPLGALFRYDGQWHVFTTEDGIARRRLVEIGHRNDFHAELVSGLDVGTAVVLHPPERLTDGAGIVQRPN